MAQIQAREFCTVFEWCHDAVHDKHVLTVCGVVGKSYVRIPAAESLSGVFSSFSIEVWVKLISKRYSSILLSAGNDVLLSWETDNSIHCNTPGTETPGTEVKGGAWRTGKDLQENIWTHVACTWDGVTKSLVAYLRACFTVTGLSGARWKFRDECVCLEWWLDDSASRRRLEPWPRLRGCWRLRTVLEG